MAQDRGMIELKDKAAAFLALHRPGDPVILPTVWDAWSATLVREAGFPALTVGSHPLADAMGKSDQEGMAFTDVVARVREITGAVDIPVSVDIESGYGLDAARLVEGLLEAGAVGLNIEDTVHGEGGRLRDPAEHADRVGALRQSADATGVHLVVNARTDVFLRPAADAPADRFESAVTRLKLAAEAGADVLYPVGRHEPDVLRRLCRELPLPVNAIAMPESGEPAAFAKAGAARVSFGPFLQRALAAEAGRLLERWR
ncbi:MULTISPECIES: isocitrate lyase/phosphoenolpyruvate mutase family protein [unclassified Nocardia]|uniref:isocitrate lyase/PEP mutase family protein n=2 Tax=Nocardia TaxID=1817 RepID=UPI0024A910CA|nr:MULTISPECIES: isocitrate lyase/phosphoenolpyruvate mutase family protein [unclassified Nocardia]